jgi:hypothetical protein
MQGIVAGGLVLILGGPCLHLVKVLHSSKAGMVATAEADRSGIEEVTSFVAKLRTDLAAVQAAVTSPWSHDYAAYCTSSLGW